MSVRLKLSIPILKTLILQSTIDFYTQQLGFTCTKHLRQYRRATLKRDNVTIIFHAGDIDENVPAKHSERSFSLYIYLENVDELWEELKDKAEICEPLGDRDWGMRQFSIFDNNGYLLIFGQRVKEEEE